MFKQIKYIFLLLFTVFSITAFGIPNMEPIHRNQRTIQKLSQSPTFSHAVPRQDAESIHIMEFLNSVSER